MEFTLGELADLTNTKVKGDKHVVIQRVATLESAKQSEISFVSNPKYKSYLAESKASAVVLSEDVAQEYSGNALIAKDPYLTFAQVVSCFHPVEKPRGAWHPSAVIDETATVEGNVDIGANVVIEANSIIREGSRIGAGSFIGKNTTIGTGSLIHSNVSIYSETIIGKNAIIHSGAVIGADGFGFALQQDKSWYKIKQIGNVVIGDDVEVGANTTVDRAALGSTVLSNGVKLDNQLQIGHNVYIGEHAIMAGGTVVAGSSKIGNRCQIGGGAAISGHIEITDDVVVTGRGMVIGSINQPGVYSSGTTTDTNKNWRRNAARFRQLDTMAKKLKKLEKELDVLKKD